MTELSKRNRRWLGAITLDAPSIDDWSEIGKLARLSSSEIAFFLTPGLPAGSRKAIVARFDGRIVGALSWQREDGGSGGTARVLAVCVDPLFRGLGLGRLLMARAELDAAQTAGQLVVSADRSTADFLQHLGYVIVGYDRGIGDNDCAAPVFHVAKTMNAQGLPRIGIEPKSIGSGLATIIAPPIRAAAAAEKPAPVLVVPKSARVPARRGSAKPLH